MKRLLRRLSLVLAPVAGLVLVALAVDVVVTWRAVAADDFRFQAAPARQLGLWESPGLAPADLGARVLGIEDDLEYRRTTSLFTRSRPGRAPYPGPQLAALRGQTTLQLTRTSAAETSTKRRAQLLNFLGTLPLDRRIQDQAERASVLQTAIGIFESAVRADPENADAKVNLELVLRISNEASVPANEPTGERGGGTRSGSGSTGGGY
jgi:hypothetical protein